MRDRPDHAAELKRDLTDPQRVLSALGLLDRASLRQRGGYIIRCPWHADRTPSCSVQLRSGFLQIHCHACHAGGEGADVLGLIAQVRGLDLRSEFQAVLLEAAEISGRYDIVDQLEGRPDPRPAPPPKPDPPPEPERTYPDPETIQALLGACVRVDADQQCSAWLKSRGLDPIAIALRDLALALPVSAPIPDWARYRGSSWIETGHRLIVPVFDHLGTLRSVRGCRVVDGESPKRLPPAGHKAAGLVMADGLGRLLLSSGWPTWAPSRVQLAICEGEPDWLTWASRMPVPSDVAVLGITSGSWTEDFVARIPDGATVAIWTDHDRAGDKYAAQIINALFDRCTLIRGEVAA